MRLSKQELIFLNRIALKFDHTPSSAEEIIEKAKAVLTDDTKIVSKLFRNKELYNESLTHCCIKTYNRVNQK